MYNYYSEIDKTRTKIVELNKVLIQQYPTTEIIKPKKKVISNENAYALNQIQWRQKCINYRRDMKKYPDGKDINYDVINKMQDMENLINDTEYKKSWGRLDRYQKKIKLKEFIGNLNKYSIEIRDNIYKELSKLVDNDKIKKTSQVKYDIDNCKIISIKCLELNENDCNYIINI